ncbi:hypothetical protein OOK27_51120 [Streptomyces canus]|uniref:hypothetical protein n=1 Tax=Streptomyces canus TaxID=58343 RepID=UPI00225464E1|nr:hypothetical protein [Streptomyces canus]MCX5262373.1 hypothetical protein [Streptomyces canus]
MALSALCLAGFVIQLDVTIVNVALPTIQHELQTAHNAWSRSSAATPSGWLP